MYLFQILLLFSGLTAALPAVHHLQQRQSGPTDVSIAEITYTGAACNASTVAGSRVSDPTTLTVPRIVFKAETGKDNSKVVDTRASCQMTIKLSHAAGWQSSVAKADYYGRVKLPPGTEAFSKTTYSYSTGSSSLSRQYYFDAPMDGIYFRNDRFSGSSALWSPCSSGSSLNINSEVRVNPVGSGASRPASIEIFNPYGGKVVIAWRKC